MFCPPVNHPVGRNIPYLAQIIKLADLLAEIYHIWRKLSSWPIGVESGRFNTSSRLSSIRKASSHQCSVHCGKQLLINPERHLSKIQCIRIRKRALIDCIKRFHIFCIFLHDVQILTHEGHRIV